jgi:hypothetical protein
MGRWTSGPKKSVTAAATGSPPPSQNGEPGTRGGAFSAAVTAQKGSRTNAGRVETFYPSPELAHSMTRSNEVSRSPSSSASARWSSDDDEVGRCNFSVGTPMFGATFDGKSHHTSITPQPGPLCSSDTPSTQPSASTAPLRLRFPEKADIVKNCPNIEWKKRGKTARSSPPLDARQLSTS